MTRERPAMGRTMAILAVVLLALTACATVRGTRPSSMSGTTVANNAVPWIDEPATWPSSSPARPPSAPACAAADLSAIAAVADRRLGISQEDAANVTVTNVGRERCTLSGTPVLLTHVGAHDERVPTGNGIWSSGSVIRPASIAVGEHAFVQVAKTIACNGGTGDTLTASRLALLVGHARIPISGLTLSGTCPGVFVSPWFTLPPETRSPFAGLTASIDAGAGAVRGKPLTYTVELTNPSNVPVALDPCPAYGESIGKHMRLYRLNCAPRVIGPESTLRFAMVLDVPADLAPGATVVGWQLIDATDISASATRPITVTD